MTSIPYFKKYLIYLKENNYSKTSIVSYQFGLRNFYNYLIENNYRFNQINLILINDYIKHLINTTSTGTAHVYLSGLKKYLFFIKKDAKLNFDINNINKIKRQNKENKKID